MTPRPDALSTPSRRSATAAGLDGAAVRDEGARLAAAVAESVPGAATGWLAAVGAPDATFGAFFAAASSARRWRSAPTDLLTGLVGTPHAEPYAAALADVVSAACDLGPAPIDVIARASATAAVQRAAVHGAGRPTAPRPSCRRRSTCPASTLGVRPVRAGPAAAARRRTSRASCRSTAAHVRRTIRPPPGRRSSRRCRRGEARQDPRGAARRARRARRAGPREGRDPAADAAPARRAPAHRGRADRADADPAPGVPGQPRDRQDDGRPPGRRASTGRSGC